MSLFPLDPQAGALLSYFLLAAFTGGIRAVYKAREKEPLRTVLAYSAACGVSGLIVSLACMQWLGPNQPILLYVVLAGWFGPGIVDRATAKVAERMGVVEEDTDVDPHPTRPITKIPVGGDSDTAGKGDQ